jgi:hypothetical protein
MRTYIVYGSRRSNRARVCILVDAEYNATGTARQFIDDDDIVFTTSMNVSTTVPEDTKNILFNGDEELYAKVPQLRPELDPKWKSTRSRQRR